MSAIAILVEVQVDERKEGTQQRTRARVPLAGLVDVDLAARVVEAERYWRNDRDRVLFVVDMCDRRVLRVDVIRESLIPDLQERREKISVSLPITASHQRTNPWKTIDYSANSSVGELEGEECGIEKRNGSPWYNKSEYKCSEQS